MGYIQRHNSTIRIKTRQCSSCGKDSQIFSKGRCQDCARIEDALALNEKEIEKTDGLPELLEEAWVLVSRYVRLSAADVNGNCKCYTCDWVGRWQDCDAGHYIPRGNMLLRFDVTRNIRPQCQICNRHKRGNRAVFAQNLEKEHPGIVDIITEESLLVYHITRDEVRQTISEYTQKLSQLKRSA